MRKAMKEAAAANAANKVVEEKKENEDIFGETDGQKHPEPNASGEEAFDDTHLLGMDLNETPTGCIIHGQTYILDNFGDESYLPGDERSNAAPDMPATPDLLSALLNDTSPTLDDKLRREYQVLLGKCRWLCKVRSEIEHPMALLSAYASKPTQLCYRRLCQLVRYLKATPTLGLTFDGRERDIIGFSDADHNTCEP
jgi:hypothetical protein